MDDKLKQMELFLKNEKFLNNKLGKKNISLDKDQLIKCFELFINNKQSKEQDPLNTNNDDNIKNIPIDNSNDPNGALDQDESIELNTKQIYSINTTTVRRNKNKKNNIGNLDDIPIMQKKVDFNKLVEEQLAKGEYQCKNNLQKKHIEYKSRPKYIDKYKLSEPTEVRKYKYYSDNFKPKNKKEEKETDEFTFAPKRVSVDKNYQKNTNENQPKEPMDSDEEIKMMKKEYQENTHKKRIPEEISGIDPTNIKCDKSNKPEMLSYQNQQIEDEDYLCFNTEKKVKGLLTENKVIGLNPYKNSMIKDDKNLDISIDKLLKIKTAEDIEEDIIAKILMQKKETKSTKHLKTPNASKKNSFNGKLTEFNEKPKGQKGLKNTISNNKITNLKTSYLKEEEDYNEDDDDDNLKDENNSHSYIKEKEDEDEDNDARDIFELFSGSNNCNDISVEASTILNAPKQKIIPKPSKIMSKYFKEVINKNPRKGKKILVTSSKNKSIPKKANKKIKIKPQEAINELVKEKIAELNLNIDKLNKENNRIEELKIEYERITSKLQTEREEYAKKKEEGRLEFEKKKEEEIKKLKNQKEIKLQNTNLLQNFPNKQEREKIDLLKEKIMKLQEEAKEKELKNRLSNDRLKKQVEEAQKKNEELLKEIKLYEELRSKKNNKINLNMNNESNNSSFCSQIKYIQDQNKPNDSIPSIQQKARNYKKLTNLNQNSYNPNCQNTSFNESNKYKSQDNDTIEKYDENGNDGLEYIEDYKTKDKTKSESIEIVFLSQYHDHKLKLKQQLIREDMTSDGKIIKFYNDKKEVLFPSGMKKEIYNDGYQVTFFQNKDVKQFYPNGKEVYFFSEQDIVQIKWPDGVQAFKFSNGNIQQVFPDGSKLIKYPNGSKDIILSDGREFRELPDGTKFQQIKNKQNEPTIPSEISNRM